MRFISLFSLLIAVLFPALSQAMSCRGYHEFMDDKKTALVSGVTLNVEYENSKILKLSADLDDAHFLARGQKADHSYVIMITVGPDFERGVTAGLTWDKNDHMRISHFDGAHVYRLVCTK